MPTRTIMVDDLEVALTRKRVRNINLRVRSDLSVHVSAAPRVPQADIEAFVRARRSWIDAARTRLRGRARALDEACDEGSVVRVWGEPLTCTIVAQPPVGRRAVCRIAREGDLLVVSADERIAGADEEARAARQQALRSWLRKELTRAAGALLPHCEQVVGRQAAGLRYRSMRSRWGSCNVRTGMVTLNTQLVHFGPRCLEYVLTHELCHLIEPSHNARFHALLDAFCPQWHEATAELSGK